MESVANATSNYRLLFIASEDDEPEIEALRSAGADYITNGVSSDTGQYARKINAGYRGSTEPYLFTGADDLGFHEGWLEAALWHRPAQVIGTNDLGNARVLRGVHATHSLVTRRYVDKCGLIDEPGKVLYEGYQHEFCDDELVGTAKARGVWAFAHDSHVEHLHPDYGKAPSDDLYSAQGERMNASRKLFTKRQRLWA